jgi:hypothetical protein
LERLRFAAAAPFLPNAVRTDFWKMRDGAFFSAGVGGFLDVFACCGRLSS